jgi:hypothetical protein
MNVHLNFVLGEAGKGRITLEHVLQLRDKKVFNDEQLLQILRIVRDRKGVK